MSVAPLLTPIPAPSASVMKLVERAIWNVALIEPGDRVAVSISGGKDSLLLYLALDQLRQRADVEFEIMGVQLDQREPGFDRKAFDANLEAFGIECLVIEEDALTPSELGVSTIRPLILVEERKIVAWVAQHGLSPDECPESRRRDLKTLLNQVEKIQPEFRESVRDALYGGGI